ncbi:MAG TPA: hypothetical protein VKE69_11910 [Planctomycetota bacterium]|nr:hypothetical protein [Planctomycetota bacterium]
MSAHSSERRHSAEHDAILRRVVVGEADEQAADVRSLVARCDECKTALAEMLSTVALLDTAAGEVRELIHPAGGDAAPLEHARIEAAVRGLAAPAGPRRRGVWISVAAVALLAVGARLFWNGSTVEDAPGVDVPLGASIECEAPRGGVADAAEFRWHFPLPDGAHFEVVVHDDADPAREPVARSPRLRESRWAPGPIQLPRTIRWEVTARDPAGRLLARGEARASLTSR